MLSPRDLVFRPDNMDETVPHTGIYAIINFNPVLQHTCKKVVKNDSIYKLLSEKQSSAQDLSCGMGHDNLLRQL